MQQNITTESQTAPSRLSDPAVVPREFLSPPHLAPTISEKEREPKKSSNNYSMKELFQDGTQWFNTAIPLNPIMDNNSVSCIEELTVYIIRMHQFFEENHLPPKDWHKNGDYTALRNRTTKETVSNLPLFWQINQTVEWQERLLTMSKYLECILFHEACTLEEYADYETLQDRLQNLWTSFQKLFSDDPTVPPCLPTAFSSSTETKSKAQLIDVDMAEKVDTVVELTSAGVESNCNYHSRDEEDSESSVVCEACLDGTVYDGNDILFCDNCNVAVHQSCYSISSIPEGAWFCDACASDADPRALRCELCSNVGGVYKRTEKSRKWVHVLCALWIPEILEAVPRHESTAVASRTHMDLKYLNKGRYLLECDLCSSRGACIQCSSSRCIVAAHPWCVLKNPQGFVGKTITKSRGKTAWMIFCKAHAKEAYKPGKSKTEVENIVTPKVRPQHNSASNSAIECIVIDDDPPILYPIQSYGQSEGKGMDLEDGSMEDTCHLPTHPTSPLVLEHKGYHEEAIFDESYLELISDNFPASSCSSAATATQEDASTVRKSKKPPSKLRLEQPSSLVWAPFIPRRAECYVGGDKLHSGAAITHSIADQVIHDDSPMSMPTYLPPPVLLSGRKRKYCETTVSCNHPPANKSLPNPIVPCSADNAGHGLGKDKLFKS